MAVAWNQQPTLHAITEHGRMLGGEAIPRLAVVIPCYRAADSILGVIAGVGPWAEWIYCVDDCCPDGTADHIEQHNTDSRVVLIRRPENGGVGAATLTGFQAALNDGADILVKVDSDGQMDPRLIPDLVHPIVVHEADYVKGNRFFSPSTIRSMPWSRLAGNAGLSFMSKLSTGYWDVFDPTNGFTAIAGEVAREIPFEEVHSRYFFESDMLFQLSLLRARVMEMPQVAIYGEEKSHLSELDALLTFPGLHLKNFLRRVNYNYFVRNFSAASMSLLTGLAFTFCGALFGAVRWWSGHIAGDPNSAGTVMLAALPIMLGIQLLLSFLQHDIGATPSQAIHTRLSSVRVGRTRVE